MLTATLGHGPEVSTTCLTQPLYPIYIEIIVVVVIIQVLMFRCCWRGDNCLELPVHVKELLHIAYLKQLEVSFIQKFFVRVSYKS